MTRYDVLRRRQFERAIADAERAVATNPNCSAGYEFLSDTLTFAGKPQEALGAAEKATRLDPVARDTFAYLTGRAYVWLGRPQEAIPFLQRQEAATPNAPYAHIDLAVAYIEAGRERDARAEAAEFMRGSPEFVLFSPEKGPFKDIASNRRFVDDLRKAGLK